MRASGMPLRFVTHIQHLPAPMETLRYRFSGNTMLIRSLSIQCTHRLKYECNSRVLSSTVTHRNTGGERGKGQRK